MVQVMDNKQVTAEWIAQQRAICDAATPGPWSRSDFASVLVFTDYEICQCVSDNDMEFITTARTALPAAIDALEASMQREAEKDTTIARLTAERDAAVSDMFGCMSTQGQCVRCKKRYYCDGTDDDKFSPLCKNNSHCYAWEWRGLHADNTDAPTGAGSEADHAE
jgi:hypothetical protein